MTRKLIPPDHTKRGAEVIASTAPVVERALEGLKFRKKIPCPFVYATGKRCDGYVSGIELYKANMYWECEPDGMGTFTWRIAR